MSVGLILSVVSHGVDKLVAGQQSGLRDLLNVFRYGSREEKSLTFPSLSFIQKCSDLIDIPDKL